MNYQDLDEDTKAVINAMCGHTGKTIPQAIGELIELGMLSMIASVSDENYKSKVQTRISDVVNKDENLKNTAHIYKSVWNIS